jgi:hypothetical protein
MKKLFSFISILFLLSEADLPLVLTKDTQTECSSDVSADGTEKIDEDKQDKKETKHWSVDRIKKEYRRFNIDLAPKVYINLLTN